MKLWSMLLALVLAIVPVMALAEETPMEGEMGPIRYEIMDGGSYVVVTLEGNATTGYVWDFELIQEEELIMEDVAEEEALAEQAAKEPEGDVIAGAPVPTVFVFAPTLLGGEGTGGMATVKLTYARPWEGGEVDSVWEMDLWVYEAGTLNVEEIRQVFPEPEAE